MLRSFIEGVRSYLSGIAQSVLRSACCPCLAELIQGLRTDLADYLIKDRIHIIFLICKKNHPTFPERFPKHAPNPKNRNWYNIRWLLVC